MIGVVGAKGTETLSGMGGPPLRTLEREELHREGEERRVPAVMGSQGHAQHRLRSGHGLEKGPGFLARPPSPSPLHTLGLAWEREA